MTHSLVPSLITIGTATNFTRCPYFLLIQAYSVFGRIASNSLCGRGITCTDTNSPTRLAASLPASVAALTAPTSPDTKTVTNPAPISSIIEKEVTSDPVPHVAKKRMKKGK